MPFYDAYGNELVSYGPQQQLFPDSGLLIEPSGGRSRALGGITTRRRVEVINALQVNDTAITTGGTYTFGQPFAVDGFNELLVFVDRSGTPVTAPTGLQLEVQVCDCFGGASNGWINLQAAIAITIPNNTYVGVMSLNQFTNFGALMRFGLTATAVGTGTGVENVIAMLKG
jgi:hypothetical protein